MLNEIENIFRDLISALQTARLYPDWHPEFKKGIDKAYVSLQNILQKEGEFIIGIVGEELAYEKDIFFDLSRIVKPAILHLKERGVEKIKFLRNLEREELSKFISYLVIPKDKITKDPQEHLDATGIKNIIVGKIKVAPPIKAGNLPKLSIEQLMQVYDKSFDNLNDSVGKILDGEEIDYLFFRGTVNNIMDGLLGRYQDLLNLAKVKRYDIKTFYHILNVSILSMYFASKLGFARDQILDIGVAALLHDTGKLYISRKILKKPAKLSDEEFSSIKNHTILGTKILLKYVDRLGFLPVLVCFEHHLKYSLKGYPNASFYTKLHPASMIVSICDVYDALFQRRTYKRDYPPNMIYDLMMREKNDAFEPNLLDKFFKIVGVWPIGTIVVLTDQRVATVIEENEDDIFSPIVEVVSPKDKIGILDLRTVKKDLRIERSLNPLSEGKDYLPLTYESSEN